VLDSEREKLAERQALVYRVNLAASLALTTLGMHVVSLRLSFQNMASKVFATKRSSKTTGDYSVLSGGDMRAGCAIRYIGVGSGGTKAAACPYDDAAAHRMNARATSRRGVEPGFQAVSGVNGRCAASCAVSAMLMQAHMTLRFCEAPRGGQAPVCMAWSL
jgi:hypothetical protein